MHHVLNGRAALWGLAALLLAGGCDDCDRPTPPPMPKVQVSAQVDEPDGAPLDAAWKRVSAPLTAREVPAPDEAVRYATPKCALGYQVRVRSQHEVSDRDAPTGDESVAAVTLTPPEEGGDAACTLETKLLSIDSFSYGRRRAKGSHRPTLPNIGIAITPRLLNEVGGPSALWVAHTLLPPLTAFFPELPEDTHVGSKHTWHRRTMRADVVAKLHAARGRHPEVKMPQPPELVDDVELEVVKWLELSRSGTEGPPRRAMLMTASWSVHDTGNDSMPSERIERWRGQFVIDATGVLLHGIMVGNRYHWWSSHAGESASKRGHSEWEIGLVEDCDGPVLLPLSATLPPVPAQMPSAAASAAPSTPN